MMLGPSARPHQTKAEMYEAYHLSERAKREGVSGAALARGNDEERT